MMAEFNIGDSILWFSKDEPLFGVVKWIGDDETSDYIGVEFSSDVSHLSNLSKAPNGCGYLVRRSETKLQSSDRHGSGFQRGAGNSNQKTSKPTNQSLNKQKNFGSGQRGSQWRGRGEQPPGRGGPPPGRGGPPPGRGWSPPGRGGPSPGRGWSPPGRGGPPPGSISPPPPLMQMQSVHPLLQRDFPYEVIKQAQQHNYVQDSSMNRSDYSRNQGSKSFRGRGDNFRGMRRVRSGSYGGDGGDMYGSQESLVSNDGSVSSVRGRGNCKRQQTRKKGGSGKKGNDVRKLFVGGLLYSVTGDELRDYFEEFGTVVDAFTPKRSDDHSKNRGFGFVEFSDAYMARDALNSSSPHVINGRKVDVRFTNQEKKEKKEKQPQKKDDDIDEEEVIRKAINALCNTEGTDGISNVASKLEVTTEVLKKITSSYQSLFDLNDKTKKMKLKLSLCIQHASRGCTALGDCSKFHLCRDYVSGGCKFSDDDCEFGHNLESYHNNKIREGMLLDEVSVDTLLEVLSKVDGLVRAPLVCLPYNENKCTNSDSTCTNLHVCLREVTSQCDNAKCSVKNHDVLNKDCKTLLEKRRIPLNQSRKEIMTLVSERLRNNKEVQNFLKVVEREKANRRSLKAEKVEEGDVEIAEICIPYMNGKCSNDGPGMQCKRLHSKKSYQWQLCSNSKWINLLGFLSDQLEQNFSDVNTDSVVLEVVDPRKLKPDESVIVKTLGTDTWTADYSKMGNFKVFNSTGTSHLDLRRLSTESSAITSDSHATEWRWYFKDDHQRWIEYGQISSKGTNHSSVDSNAIEKDYQQNKTGTMTFSTPEFSSYTLDFTTLKQKNNKVGTERFIKRRPTLSQQGSSKGFTTSDDYRHLPRTWIKMAPHEQCKLVVLQPQTAEYKEILAVFSLSLGRVPVMQSIQRVQNPYLREMYENRKKYMSKCLGKPEISIERRLFHGTDPNNIDAIANQNFDWRLHGSASGQAYGRGVYFASTSRYSDGYSSRGGPQKKMFIAKVLVGNIVHGNSSMIRPGPMPGNPQATYDTSVDNVSNPSIYVKYADQEMYPEYVLSYT